MGRVYGNFEYLLLTDAAYDFLLFVIVAFRCKRFGHLGSFALAEIAGPQFLKFMILNVFSKWWVAKNLHHILQKSVGHPVNANISFNTRRIWYIICSHAVDIVFSV